MDRQAQPQAHRSKEKYVREAIECVKRWRDIFENGYKDEGGNIFKVSLQQAADIVKVSKKTLEDYYSILRKAEQMMDLDDVLNEKMGYLRNLLRTNKIGPTQSKLRVPSPPQYRPQDNLYQPMQWDNMIIESNQFCSPSLHEFQQQERGYQRVMQIEESPSTLFNDYMDHNNSQMDQYYYDDQFNNEHLAFFTIQRSFSRNSAGAEQEQFVQTSPEE